MAVLAAVPFIYCTAAFAEEEGHGGHHHAGSIADLAPYWINFLLYLGLLIVTLRKPISKAWAARIENIEASVNKGKNEREFAERALKEAKARETALLSEIKKITSQIKQESETESVEIVQDAKIRAERTKSQGKDMITAEAKAYEVSLKRALAEEVVKRATEILMREMNPEKDSRLRSSALKEIGSLVH